MKYDKKAGPLGHSQCASINDTGGFYPLCTPGHASVTESKHQDVLYMSLSQWNSFPVTPWRVCSHPRLLMLQLTAGSQGDSFLRIVKSREKGGEGAQKYTKNKTNKKTVFSNLCFILLACKAPKIGFVTDYSCINYSISLISWIWFRNSSNFLSEWFFFSNWNCLLEKWILLSLFSDILCINIINKLRK